MFSFIETKLFSKLVDQYLSDDEYASLQRTLMSDPEAGDLIPESGGVRKIRWSIAGRGKRGGLRVIYYSRVRQGNYLDAYALSEKCDRQYSRLRAQKD